MKRFLVAAVGVVALGIAGHASAADLPPTQPYTRAPPVIIPAFYDWSGFYTGLNGGWGTGRNCWDRYTPGGAFVAAEGCHTASGGFGGGQIGYRLQASSFVFGIEVQGDWAVFRGSNVSLNTPAHTNTTHIDSFGLFTGHVGYAFNTVLLYVKGGAAITGDRFSIVTNPGNIVTATAATTSRWSGTVGAGVEFAFIPDWSVAVEYDHLFTQDKPTTFVAAGAFVQLDRLRQNADMVSVRINYRWGGPVIAKY